MRVNRPSESECAAGAGAQLVAFIGQRGVGVFQVQDAPDAGEVDSLLGHGGDTPQAREIVAAVAAGTARAAVGG